MKVLKQTGGFILFLVVIEAIWILLRVDVVEDLNIFGEAPCWPWPISAVVLFTLFAAATRQIRRPVVRHTLVFGMLAALLGLGLLVPPLIGGDGFVIGMFQFLNSYWILTVAAYWAFLLVGSRIFGRRKANQSLEATCPPAGQ